MIAHDVAAWSIAVLAGASAACGAAYAQTRAGSLVARYAADLERELRYQGAPWVGARVARAQLQGIALLVALAALTAAWLPLLIALVVAVAPRLVLRRMRLRRTARIEQQLDGFLIALAHALRATPALGDGLRSSAEVVAPPLANELQLLLREHDLGAPLDRALDGMARRIGSPVAGAALATLRVARSSGGDFVHTLEQSAASLREMARLEGVVRTKTAEGRAQTVVVSALPVPLLYTIDGLSPGLLDELWTTDIGNVLVAIALALWMASIVAARRISQVDV